jgi:signal transduction histidine kinase
LEALLSAARQSAGVAGLQQESRAGPRYPGLGLITLILTATGILSCLRHFVYRQPQSALEMAAAMTACTVFFYPWIALTPLVFRLEQRFPLGSERWFRNALVLALLSMPVSALAAPVMSACFGAVMAAADIGVPYLKPKVFWLGHFFSAQVLFWCSVAGGYTVRTRHLLSEQAQTAARLAAEKSQLETSLRQAQLEVIRARLNPHFLFNSLQNISAMTKQDPQTASRMLARLGDLLRMVLRQDSEPECTLEQEIELTNAYVALEQMRFGDRLDVQWNISGDAREALLPCFLLQPLVENAIVHGLGGVGGKGVISISAAAEDGHLCVRIEDNGIGLPAKDLSNLELGVGLASTRQRLETMYPGRHAFDVRQREEGGVEVRISIPLRKTSAPAAHEPASRP